MSDAKPEEFTVWPPEAIKLLRVVLFVHFAANLLLGAWMWLATIGRISLRNGFGFDQNMTVLNLIFLLCVAPTLPLTLTAGIVVERRPATAQLLLFSTWVIAVLQVVVAAFVLFVMGWFYSLLLISVLVCPPVLLIEITLATQYESREWLRRMSWRPPC